MTALLETPPSTRGAHPHPTRRGSRVGARLGAAALVIGAAGNTAQAVLSQVLGERPDDIEGQLAMAQQHPVLLTAMSVVGLVAVPFMAVGFLATAQELGRRARRTAALAAGLLTVGMWGFLGIQVAQLIQVRALLADAGTPAARALGDMGGDPVLGALFGLPFFAGCVLGMLTLTVALLVRGGVPRWIPAAWLVFIVWDFTVGRVGPIDPHWLYLAGAAGLASYLLGGRGRSRAGA